MTLFLSLLILIPMALIAALVWVTWNTKRKVEAAVPPRGKFLPLSTGPMHYVDKGAGPAIVMIHGLGAQLGNFDFALTDALSGTHRCIALDRPGMGYSERPDDAPANPRSQAALIAEAIDKLGLERPLIVGHSLGGAIALCLALDHPEKIRGLALLAPLTRAGDPPSPAFAPLMITSNLKRRLISWTLATPMGMRNTAQVFDLVFGPDPVPERYSTKGGGLLGLRPASFFNTSRDFMGSARDLKWMMQNYANLSVPVHILFGKEDRILTPQTHAHALVAEHPAIKLTMIDGGHMLPLTKPDDCVEFIRAADHSIAG